MKKSYRRKYQIAVYVEPELYLYLEAHAKSEQRTLSNEARYRLLKTLNKDDYPLRTQKEEA